MFSGVVFFNFYLPAFTIFHLERKPEVEQKTS